jgi:hypothetical protein
MTEHLKSLLLAAALVTTLGSFAVAQSASTVGSGGASSGPAGSAATGGSAGSAAVGGTSASTVGSGGTSTSPAGTTSSSIGSGGSAAGGLKNTARTNIGGNANNLHSMSRARAQDRGTWSRSMTRTKVHKGEVMSRTRSMAHEPGGAPVKSTTTVR